MGPTMDRYQTTPKGVLKRSRREEMSDRNEKEEGEGDERLSVISGTHLGRHFRRSTPRGGEDEGLVGILCLDQPRDPLSGAPLFGTSPVRVGTYIYMYIYIIIIKE